MTDNLISENITNSADKCDITHTNTNTNTNTHTNTNTNVNIPTDKINIIADELPPTNNISFNSDVEILIDNREHAMIDMLNESKCPIIVSQLDIGDIQYKYAGELKLIIERKSINDLIASVKDGRYKEQKFRLVHASNSACIMYIIEGRIN